MAGWLNTARLALVIWLGIWTSTAHAQDVASALVGRWDAVTRSTGGIGQIMELRADGSMTHWYAVMVEFTYVVQGSLLITSFTPATGGAVEQTTTEIRFEGDVLIQKSTGSGGLETRMDRKRPGGLQDPPIVGVWSYPHDTGKTAFMLYSADGRLIFRLPIRAARGRWSVSGDQLRLGPMPATTRVTYRVEGDQLVLTDDQGKQVTYTRAELVEF